MIPKYENEILLACTSGIKELEAIADYTQKLIESESDEMKAIYTDNRRDELPHIQNIVIAITAMVSGESPKIAEEVG
ncbi:hypothetical protein AGMMS49975_06160 [Clostridia bacterium]|nr:hypothetical protein AGMMS49975_06160 [Clostridia bacterium]